MGYEVEYLKSDSPQPCSRSACFWGGKISKGQLRFTKAVEHNGNVFKRWLHISCASDSQRRNILRKLASASDLIGFETLAAADKAYINQLFGWTQNKAHERRLNHEPQDSLLDTASPNVEAERPPENGALASSSGAALAESLLREEPLIWRASTLATAVPSAESQSRGRPLGSVNNGELSSLYNQLSSLAFVPAKSSTTSLGTIIDKEAGVKPRGTSLSTNDEMRLMQLELEEKEARVRLAIAELEVAKSEVKAETARHAVIEQKLRIAKTRMLHDEPVVPVI